MPAFATRHLPPQRDVVATDGSDVRILLKLDGGSMAHFELAPGQTSKAIVHRTVEEIWYVVSGHGQMWRQQDDEEAVVELYPGLCLTIPLGTRFQFRAHDQEPLAAVAITMPPWPENAEGEATVVPGAWPPTA